MRVHHYRFIVLISFLTVIGLFSGCLAPTESGNPNGESNSENLEHQFVNKSSVEDETAVQAPQYEVVVCISSMKFFYNGIKMFEKFYTPYLFVFDQSGEKLDEELELNFKAFDHYYLEITPGCPDFPYSAMIRDSGGEVIYYTDKPSKITFSTKDASLSVGNNGERFVLEIDRIINFILRNSGPGALKDANSTFGGENASGLIRKFTKVQPLGTGVD